MNLADAQAQATYQHIVPVLDGDRPSHRLARDPWPELTTFTVQYLLHPEKDPGHVVYDSVARVVTITCHNGTASYAVEPIEDSRDTMVGRLQLGATWLQVG